MKNLVAVGPLRYGGRSYVKGDTFAAPDHDARMLTMARKARHANSGEEPTETKEQAPPQQALELRQHAAADQTLETRQMSAEEQAAEEKRLKRNEYKRQRREYRRRDMQAEK